MPQSQAQVGAKLIYTVSVLFILSWLGEWDDIEGAEWPSMPT